MGTLACTGATGADEAGAGAEVGVGEAGAGADVREGLADAAGFGGTAACAGVLSGFFTVTIN